MGLFYLSKSLFVAELGGKGATPCSSRELDGAQTCESETTSTKSSYLCQLLKQFELC
jgi:hypothetical protein